MTLQDLERALASSDPAPVYLIAGPEVVLRDRAIRALRGHVIDPAFEAFNFRSVEPSGLDAASIVEEMRVLPMGGGRRLVVIAPAEDLLKDQVKTLGEYAGSPAPHTCLVLAAAEVKESLRKAFEKAVLVECASPWEDRLPALLATEAKDLGVRLDREAGSALAALCGRDLSRAVGELQKAATRVGPGGVITATLIRDLAGGGESGDVYRIASALARGDPAGAVRAARRFVEGEEKGQIRVLWEIGMYLRRLLAARSNLDAGMPAREAARAARVFWKDLDAFAAEVRRWDETRIASAFRRLLAADRVVKRGIDDGSAAIESCLWAICQRERGAPGPVTGARGREGRA